MVYNLIMMFACDSFWLDVFQGVGLTEEVLWGSQADH